MQALFWEPLKFGEMWRWNTMKLVMFPHLVGYLKVTKSHQPLTDTTGDGFKWCLQWILQPSNPSYVISESLNPGKHQIRGTGMKMGQYFSPLHLKKAQVITILPSMLWLHLVPPRWDYHANWRCLGAFFGNVTSICVVQVLCALVPTGWSLQYALARFTIHFSKGTEDFVRW